MNGGHILRRATDTRPGVMAKMPEQTKLEELKIILDKIVSSAQNDNQTVQVSIELNIRNGGIGNMFIQKREQI